MNLTVASATFGALLLVLDNALVTQSRLILLDSMLLCFCIMTVYCWIRFYKLRYQPFTLQWKMWLCLTGVFIAATLGYLFHHL